MSVDGDLSAKLHTKVAERLSEHLRTLDGEGPLSLDDERALTRSLIAAELKTLAEDACRNGGSPLDSATESELAEAVFDRVHGWGGSSHTSTTPTFPTSTSTATTTCGWYTGTAPKSVGNRQPTPTRI